MRRLVALCAVAAAAAQADIEVPAHLREGLTGATLRKHFKESGGWFTGTVEGIEDDGRVRVHWHEDGTRTHLGLEEAHRHRVDDDDSLAYTDDDSYANAVEVDDDDGDDDDDALDEEERRELVRKRRLHLQRRAEAAKKRAQHLRSAAAARAVDEQREKAEREETKDAVFEKPPPVPPVPPGGNIFRLQLRGPFKAHGGAQEGQIYGDSRDEGPRGEGAAWRVGWMCLAVWKSKLESPKSLVDNPHRNHGGSMKKFFVRLAGPLVDEASGLLCTQRGDVRALSMHVAFRMNGDADDGSLRDKTGEGFAVWLTDKISPWTGPTASMDLRSRGGNPNTLGVWARASGEVVVEANGQVIERCSAATRFRTGSAYHPALNVTRLRVDVEPSHEQWLAVNVEVDEGRGAGFKPCGRVDLPPPLDAAWLHGAYPAITGSSTTDAVDLVRFAAAGSVDENDGEDTVEEALRRLNSATGGVLRHEVAIPLRDDREDLTFGERLNKIEVAVSALDANFNHLMWVIEHAMLQRRDHVNELLQNQALKQAKDVRKLKALEEEYRMDVEDHLEEKIAQLEEQLAGHANWAAAHAEHKSFAETHERFEEVREMTPAGGYPSFLLWVLVLVHVIGGVAYYQAYAHLKKQTKVV